MQPEERERRAESRRGHKSDRWRPSIERTSTLALTVHEIPEAEPSVRPLPPTIIANRALPSGRPWFAATKTLSATRRLVVAIRPFVCGTPSLLYGFWEHYIGQAVVGAIGGRWARSATCSAAGPFFSTGPSGAGALYTWGGQI